jgi:hypothetical protein
MVVLDSLDADAAGLLHSLFFHALDPHLQLAAGRRQKGPGARFPNVAELGQFKGPEALSSSLRSFSGQRGCRNRPGREAWKNSLGRSDVYPVNREGKMGI